MEQQIPPINTGNESLLFEDFKFTLQHASPGKRFANYLIDLAIFYILIFSLATGLYIVDFDLAEKLFAETEGFALVDRLTYLLLYAMFLGIMEMALKGRTIGKYITGTIAVNKDGTPITAETALFRGLCRAIPFNAFSALGNPSYPWHDKWTKTYVVLKKDLQQEQF
jgi:uncharacterized RDD family membrane protein YckC